MTPVLRVQTIVSPLFEENAYVVWCEGQADCVVFDPGLDSHSLLSFLEEEELSVRAILNTHGHADHIAGNAALKEAFPEAPLIIGAGDEPLLSDAMANLSAPFGMALTSPPASRTVGEGDRVEAAGLQLEVLDLPGHSPGHVVFLQRGSPCHIFSGDVLFRGSIGRFDFPGGSEQLLLDGIRRKLFTLPADSIVYPGHGPVTTIGHEQQTNPFLQG